MDMKRNHKQLQGFDFYMINYLKMFQNLNILWAELKIAE